MARTRPRTLFPRYNASKPQAMMPPAEVQPILPQCKAALRQPKRFKQEGSMQGVWDIESYPLSAGDRFNRAQ